MLYMLATKSEINWYAWQSISSTVKRYFFTGYTKQDVRNFMDDRRMIIFSLYVKIDAYATKPKQCW